MWGHPTPRLGVVPLRTLLVFYGRSVLGVIQYLWVLFLTLSSIGAHGSYARYGGVT
jgi:hypothetical protein